MELFRKSAGYRYLDAFILANVVELGTGHFCNRFLNLQNDPGGRTYAQMTHAARSGCRNFAEGSERLMTSYSTAIELLDVARASLCELRDDYNKCLMMQWQAPWPMESDEARRVYAVRLDPPDYGSDINRGVCLHVLAQYRKFEPELTSEDAVARANTLLILITRTLNMLDRYIKSVGDEFVDKGGFRERMSAVRTEARGAPQEGPACPKCGAPTRLRKTREGNRPFWGCTGYPACRGMVEYKEKRADCDRQQSSATDSNRKDAS
jgi:four helix bundle suffix protein